MARVNLVDRLLNLFSAAVSTVDDILPCQLHLIALRQNKVIVIGVIRPRIIGEILAFLKTADFICYFRCLNCQPFFRGQLLVIFNRNCHSIPVGQLLSLVRSVLHRIEHFLEAFLLIIEGDVSEPRLFLRLIYLRHERHLTETVVAYDLRFGHD